MKFERGARRVMRFGTVIFFLSCDGIILTRVSTSFELDTEANRTPVLRVRQDPDLAGEDRRNQFMRHDGGGVAVAGQNLRIAVRA